MDSKIKELYITIAESIPDLFDVNAAIEKYPTKYDQSLNNVIRQVISNLFIKFVNYYPISLNQRHPKKISSVSAK